MPAVLFEELPAQIVFRGRKALRHTRQIPNRIDRNLDHRYAAVLMHDLAVMLQTSGCDCRLQFGEIEARAGNGDARTYIDAFGNFGYRSSQLPDGPTDRARTMRCGSPIVETARRLPPDGCW